MWRTFWNFVKCPVTVPLSRGLQDRGRLDTTPKEQLNLDRLRRANAGKNEDQAGTVPYVGDAHHPVIVYDYTPTRSRVGPAKFPGRVQRLSAGRRLLGLRCLFQVATRHDGGRVLDALSRLWLYPESDLLGPVSSAFYRHSLLIISSSLARMPRFARRR